MVRAWSKQTVFFIFKLQYISIYTPDLSIPFQPSKVQEKNHSSFYKNLAVLTVLHKRIKDKEY